MPTYDYVCGGCDHRFEHFQSMTSRRLRKCPECGERKLERLVGAGAGLIFKGSGFYETDYKRAGSGAGSRRDADSSTGSASSSEASESSSESTAKTSSNGDSKAPGKDAGGAKAKKDD